MSAARSALRIRLEGKLEVIELGIERYRAARSLRREAIEQLLAYEDELGAAVEHASRLVDAAQVLRSLRGERRAFDRSLRRRLRRLGVNAAPMSPESAAQTLLERLLPEAASPAVATFYVVPKMIPFIGLSVVWLAFALLTAWNGLVWPMMVSGAALALALGRQRGQLDVFTDRVRLRGALRTTLELPLQFVRLHATGQTVDSPFGRLSIHERAEAERLVALVKKLRFGPDEP